jgi:hypothetical protein
METYINMSDTGKITLVSKRHALKAYGNLEVSSSYSRPLHPPVREDAPRQTKLRLF